MRIHCASSSSDDLAKGGKATAIGAYEGNIRLQIDVVFELSPLWLLLDEVACYRVILVEHGSDLTKLFQSRWLFLIDENI